MALTRLQLHVQRQRKIPLPDLAGDQVTVVARRETLEAEWPLPCALRAVDRIKETVPVWKKEVWEDGSEWIEGHVPEVREREG